MYLFNKPQTGTLTGRVTDMAHKPISGVNVLLDGVKKTASDRNGNYTIKNIIVGNHAVEFKKNGYITVDKLGLMAKI